MSTVTYQNTQPAPGQVAYTQPGYAPYQQGHPVPLGQPGYAPYQQGQPVPAHGQTSSVVVVTQPGVQRVGGTCPYCGVGFARTDYTLIGILIAIIFFPLGIICCMMMTERRCSHCRAKF